MTRISFWCLILAVTGAFVSAGAEDNDEARVSRNGRREERPGDEDEEKPMYALNVTLRGEADGYLEFIISIYVPYVPVNYTGKIKYAYVTTPGSAVPGVDYEYTNGKLIWDFNTTDNAMAFADRVVKVPLLDDNVIRGGLYKKFNLIFQSEDDEDGEDKVEVEGVIAITKGTIIVEDAHGTEIDGSILFRIGLSHTIDGNATLKYCTEQSTATNSSDVNTLANVDYTHVCGFVNMTNWNKNTGDFITVTIINDSLQEWDEEFYLNLQLETELPLTVKPWVIGHIIDDMEYATIYIDGDSQTIDETVVSASFNIFLSNNFQAILNPTRTIRQGASVKAKTMDGTATAGTDYEAKEEDIRFLLSNVEETPGKIRFRVDLMDDYDLEGNEYFFVHLSNPQPLGMLANRPITQDKAKVNIQDNEMEDQYQLTVNDAAGEEGTYLDFTVNMSPVQTFEVKFTIQIDGCTDWKDCQGVAIGRPSRSTRQTYGDFATGIIDYTPPASQTMSIPAGSSRTQFQVFANEDTVVERLEEVFTVSLISDEKNPIAFPTVTATGTILDNTDFSVLSVLSQDVTIPEVSKISFPFKLSYLVEAKVEWTASIRTDTQAQPGVDIESRAVYTTFSNFECTDISPVSECVADVQLIVKDFIEVADEAQKVLKMRVNEIKTGDEEMFPGRSTYSDNPWKGAIRCGQPNFEAKISQNGRAEIYVEDMIVLESAGKISFPVRSTHMSTVDVKVELHVEGLLLVAPYAGSFINLDYRFPVNQTQCSSTTRKCTVVIPALCDSVAIPRCGNSSVSDAYVNLTIVIIDDLLSEHLYEFVKVSLHSVQYPNNFRISPANKDALLTITDNDDATISISSAKTNQTNRTESADVLHFPLTFNNNISVDVDVVVDYDLDGCKTDLNNPTCAYGNPDESPIKKIGEETIYPDFDNNVTSFLATRLTTNYLLPVTLYDDDLQVECDETFQITLTQAQAINVTSEAQYRVGINGLNASATGTITSSSQSLEVYFTSNGTGTEGERLTFQVSASKSSRTPFTIVPSLTYGDYSQGRVDHVFSPVLFSAGSVTSSFNISLIADGYANPTGHFMLSFPSTAQILVPGVQNCVYQNSGTAPSSSGRGEILDSESPEIGSNESATIGFSSDTAVIAAGIARFTVSMTAPLSVPVTVNFKTFDQTARQGQQYLALEASLTFAVNQTSFDVNITLIPMGSTVHPDMIFGAILSNANSTAVVSLASSINASATIDRANSASFLLKESQPKKVLAGTPVVLQVSTGNNITGLNTIEMFLKTEDVTAKSGVDFVQPSEDLNVSWMAAADRFISKGSLSSYLVVQTKVPTNDNLFGLTNVTFKIKVSGINPKPSQITIENSSYFSTEITIVKSSGEHGIPFTSRCLAPLLWRGDDNSVAELRLDATNNPIAGEGWLISQKVYLEDCFAGFDQQNAANLTFLASCTTTNTTMNVTFDTTNSRPVPVLVFNAETIASDVGNPASEYIVIVQPILNSLTLQPITIKVKWRSPSNTQYVIDTLYLNAKTPRTRSFEMGTTWFATITDIPAIFLKNPTGSQCSTYSRGNKVVVENSGMCCSFRGGQSIASFRQCFQFELNTNVDNEKAMQVQLQSLSPGQAQACVGTVINEPQKQCWNIHIHEPLTILRIPVQYVVPDDGGNWEVKVPIQAVGYESKDATITTECDSDIKSQYSNGVLTVNGTNTDAAMRHVKIMARYRQKVHTGEFVFITVLA